MTVTPPDDPPPELAEIAASWRPRSSEVTEPVTAGPAQAMAGLFDQPAVAAVAGDVLPPLWHWLYTPDRTAQADLGADGHPRDGLLVPPVPGRSRMFGGGRAQFHGPIRIGDLLTRRSHVAAVRLRRGRTGWLLLVTVRHELSVAGQARALEEQDIVYRQGAAPTRGAAAGAAEAGDADDSAAAWSATLTADPVLLFRFSALTYNAHRIHYDRDFATCVEGYPGLVVHGPLLTLSMLELPRRFAPGRPARSLSYRLHRPLFAPCEVVVTGAPDQRGASLRAGGRGMPAACTGTIELARSRGS